MKHFTPSKLQYIRQWLTKYGTDQDAEKYKLALLALQERLLQVLVPDDSSEPVDVLLAMRSARAAWLPEVGDWPESKEWDAAEERYKKKLKSWTAEVLQKLRGNCTDLEQLETVLTDPRIKSLEPFELPEVSDFQNEISSMVELYSNIETWRNKDLSALVSSKRVDEAADALKKREGSWCGTECFNALDTELKKLRDEILTLENARGRYDSGEFEKAVRLLADSTLPAARDLRIKAERLAADKRYTDQLRNQGHGALTEEELAGASPTVKDLHKRLREGHDFSDQFHNKADSIQREAGFVATAGKILKLLSMQIPDNAELAVPEGKRFEACKDILRNTLDHLADCFLGELKNRVQFFPLPKKSNLDKLEIDLQEFLKICHLLEMDETDKQLVSDWRRSVEDVSLVLEVQRAGCAANWAEADKLLNESRAKDNLLPEESEKLRASLEVQKLSSSKGAKNEAWLELYCKWPAVLFENNMYRKRYLDCLRQSPGIEPEAHSELLERYFSEESTLRVLVAAFADPSILRNLTTPLEEKNTPLVKDLLSKLVKDRENYAVVETLWGLMDQAMQEKVWRGKSPVEQIGQQIEAVKLEAASANPSILDGLTAPLHKENAPLVKDLLSKLVKDTKNYAVVEALWESMEGPMQRKVWPSRKESPVEKMGQQIKAELKGVDAKLRDPEVSIDALKAQIDPYYSWGFKCDAVLHKVDVAKKLERTVEGWNGRDPWADELRKELEETERTLLDYFKPDIQQARGWRWALHARRNGIKAWSDLEEAWHNFNIEFSKRSTEFPENPDSWNEFKEALEGWDKALKRAVDDIDWSLPRASESVRWVHLREQWEKSREGRIWRELSKPGPEKLEELRAVFEEIADQIRRFSELHECVLSDQNEENLKQLRDLEPLSRPVEAIKRQLTDSDATTTVCNSYKNFINKQM